MYQGDVKRKEVRELSKKTMDEVVKQIASDETFAAKFFTDPDNALQGLDLTEKEKSILKNTNRESSEPHSHMLDARISKRGGWGGASRL